MRALGEEWRELVAGREGFLTGPKRAGILRRRVVWGEMDTMVSECFDSLEDFRRRKCLGSTRCVKCEAKYGQKDG